MSLWRKNSIGCGYRTRKIGLLGITMACLLMAGCQGAAGGNVGDEIMQDLTQETTVDMTQESIRETMQEQAPEISQNHMEEEELYLEMAEYKASFEVGSVAPQITDCSEQWKVDLNHDGESETIVFDWRYMDVPGSNGIFAVLSNDGTVLYVDYPARNHAGWMNYYVCQQNGRKYLMKFTPYVVMGGGTYSYSLYEWKLDDSGLLLVENKNHPLSVVDERVVDFYVGEGEQIRRDFGHWEMDVEAMVSFAYELNQYMENSYLLCSTDKHWLGDDIQNSETGMFVLGSQKEPYRQYENYSVYSNEKRPTEKAPNMSALYEVLRNWCDREGIPSIDPDRIRKDYIESYAVGSADPQITTNSVSWEADLTHDGQKERVIFDWSQFETEGVGMFAVLDRQGLVLYSDQVTEFHYQLRTYYLCNWEGNEYLFQYDPYMMMGDGEYFYELFYLTSNGEKIIADTGAVAFSIEAEPSASNQNGQRVMDIPAMVAFADQVNEYVQHSFLMVSSDWYWIPSELQTMPGGDFVIGSPKEPYRIQETFSWFDDFTETLGLDLSHITDVAKKIKTWCEAAKIPYIE